MRIFGRHFVTCLGIGLAIGASATLVGPRSAHACGGFFCNQPDNPLDQPVAQTAENVLFAMDRQPDGQFALEAHVQIFYTGPADRFSWIVPVDSEPKLDVGGNAVFGALLRATSPQFSVQYRDEGTCNPARGGFATGTGGSSAGAADAAAPGGGAPPGVSIAFRGDVGPYDATVLRATSPDDPTALITWLNDNKYWVSPEGGRLIADYVKEGKYFVAIRLQSERGTSEIQPLVMRFLGPGPCVPLRLTSIAAIKDLKVNLWVLSDHRVVPDNYFEIEINQAAINWFASGRNYDELVRTAANEAGGNAFITEYAGPTTMLARTLYVDGSYNLVTIRAAKTPPDALDAVAAQGFARDAQLLAILRTHIPLPEVLKAMGIDERTFYNNLRQYWTQHQAAFRPFDGEAFAADLSAKIVEPLRKAQALIDGHAKLTRLSTFISPEEMTSDPTFVQNPSLPDLPAQRTATAVRDCRDGGDPCRRPLRLELPDGQVVFLEQDRMACEYGSSRPKNDALAAGPALARGWKRSQDGEGLLRFDNRAAIATAIAAHNRSVPGVSAGDGCSCALGGGGAGGWPAVLPLGLLAGGWLLRRRRARR